MKRRLLTFLFALGLCATSIVHAQFGACNCTASIGGGVTKNWSSLAWSGTGCPSSVASSYTGNLCLTMANGSTLNFNIPSFTLTGDFKITNTGSNVNFDILSGDVLHVTGNMGDPSNNNVSYTIDGTLTVDGTLYGKNTNALAGSGTINAGGVDFGNSASASSTLTYNVGSCSGSGGFCTTVLPIKLASFSSSVKEKAVELKWTTSSEINFNYFSVEKSSNGKDFSEITQVPGHGTSNEWHTYQYEDNSPYIGKNYYRLTSVDFDNYRETFKVIVQDYAGDKDFHITPNPSDGLTIGLNFNFENTSDACLTIFDNIGYPVGTYQVSGIGSITFDSPLKTGIYLAKYSSDSFSKTIRFAVK